MTVHNTFVIERSYPVAPEVVFAGFSDPLKKRVWFGEGDNHDVEEFEMDFRVGGMERACYRFREGTPFPGVIFTNEGQYMDIEVGRRIVVSSRMSLGDRRISVSLATFEFLATAAGTDLIFTHQAAFFEGSDGPAMREGGWVKLLGRLGERL